MSSVSPARAAVAAVTEVDVIAVADFGHDQVVARAAEDSVVSCAGRDQIVAGVAEWRSAPASP